MSRFVTTVVGTLAENACLGTLAENYLRSWPTIAWPLSPEK